jgi:hypothetical protein
VTLFFGGKAAYSTNFIVFKKLIKPLFRGLSELLNGILPSKFGYFLVEL